MPNIGPLRNDALRGGLTPQKLTTTVNPDPSFIKTERAQIGGPDAAGGLQQLATALKSMQPTIDEWATRAQKSKDVEDAGAAERWTTENPEKAAEALRESGGNIQKLVESGHIPVGSSPVFAWGVSVASLKNAGVRYENDSIAYVKGNPEVEVPDGMGGTVKLRLNDMSPDMYAQHMAQFKADWSKNNIPADVHAADVSRVFTPHADRVTEELAKAYTLQSMLTKQVAGVNVLEEAATNELMGNYRGHTGAANGSPVAASVTVPGGMSVAPSKEAFGMSNGDPKDASVSPYGDALSTAVGDNTSPLLPGVPLLTKTPTPFPAREGTEALVVSHAYSLQKYHDGLRDQGLTAEKAQAATDKAALDYAVKTGDMSILEARGLVKVAGGAALASGNTRFDEEVAKARHARQVSIDFEEIKAAKRELVKIQNSFAQDMIDGKSISTKDPRYATADALSEVIGEPNPLRAAWVANRSRAMSDTAMGQSIQAHREEQAGIDWKASAAGLKFQVAVKSGEYTTAQSGIDFINSQNVPKRARQYVIGSILKADTEDGRAESAMFRSIVAALVPKRDDLDMKVESGLRDAKAQALAPFIEQEKSVNPKAFLPSASESDRIQAHSNVQKAAKNALKDAEDAYFNGQKNIAVPQEQTKPLADPLATLRKTKSSDPVEAKEAQVALTKEAKRLNMPVEAYWRKILEDQKKTR